MFYKRANKSNIIFLLVVFVIIIVLWFLPTGFENPALTNSTIREKGEITRVDNSDLENHSIITVGTQKLEMVILSGNFKGDTVSATNILMGRMKLDKIYKPGDKVLVVLKTTENGTKIFEARPDDIYRINIEIILFVLFSIFLVGFAKWTGLKALLSFLFTALTLWKVLIPLFLKGYSPVPISFVVVAILTTVIILLITGFTKKGAVALSGSIAGIALTTIMALVFGHFFRIPGTVKEFSETLLYAGFLDIRISDIFISGIFISAAGAVMDVAMDISAAQNELMEKKPDITTKELIKSGFSVSYPVVGTMTTTLLFAYSGSFMFVFMAFMAKGTPMINIFNINYIAAELLHTLVGSFGLVLVAPATSIIGGYVYTKHRKLFIPEKPANN